MRARVGEEVVHDAKSERTRAARAQHSLAIQALRPMQHVFLRGDAPRTAVRRHLLQARLRHLLQEERHLGQQGVDRLRCRQAPMRAADRIGLAGQTASGRSRV
jgi:hypothetical protein